MKTSIARLSMLLVGCWTFGALVAPARLAADPEEGAVEAKAVVAVDFETGVWRTKSQLIFDPATKSLTRKTFTVWDPLPSRDLDFVWSPDTPASGVAERVTGSGRLIWRIKGKPAYDPSAIYAEYRGRMSGGRAEGQGLYLDRSGLSYEGGWRKGQPEGRGTLRLRSSAEYVGEVRAGRAHGAGRFFDVDGEMFEGVFQQGLRTGRGVTVLPSGRSYRSEWVRGEEIASSRRLRLAQIGQPKGTSDDVRLAVVVDRLPTDSMALGYASSSSESGLTIQPDNKRLLGVWKGGEEIQLTENEEAVGETGKYGVFGFPKPDLPPLALIMEVQNRAVSQIQVRGAFLSVDESVTDLQPAIQLSVGGDNTCGDKRERPRYSPRFDLENFGWGPAEQAKLRFAFVSPIATARPSSLNISKNLAAISSTARIDLESELRAAGVRIEVLKQNARQGFRCRATEPSACLSEISHNRGVRVPRAASRPERQQSHDQRRGHARISLEGSQRCRQQQELPVHCQPVVGARARGGRMWRRRPEGPGPSSAAGAAARSVGLSIAGGV